MLKRRFVRNFDWILLGTTLFLVITGLMVIYSTSFKAATLVSPADVRNQIIYALIGCAALWAAARLDYRGWLGLSTPLYFLMLASLVAVRFLGHEVLGGQRWISLGFFQFQPSEPAKLVMIIVLAKFLTVHYDELNRFRYFALSLVYIIIPFGLVMSQPDLGTGLVLLVIWGSMSMASRMRKRHIAGLVALGLGSLPFIIPRLKPYQRSRLDTFINPMANPLGSGYNVVQSTIAVGSGQVFGRGLAAGSQSQLNFLPSQHTDFIFAVLAEKLGFVGSLLLLGLFGLLLARGLLIAYHAGDRFGMFVAVGIVAMLLFHVLVNIGMNIGIMPVTGIPLPFVSYGGTSLIIAMVSIGLLLSIRLRQKKLQFG